MRPQSALRLFLSLMVLSPTATFAQSSQSASSPPVPRLINVTGTFRPADGRPAATVETVTLSIYADQQGGAQSKKLHGFNARVSLSPAPSS